MSYILPKSITRVDDSGHVYVAYDVEGVELSLQEDERVLKVFVKQSER